MTPVEHTLARFRVIARTNEKVWFKPVSDDRPGEAYQVVYECHPSAWDAGTPWAKVDS